MVTRFTFFCIAGVCIAATSIALGQTIEITGLPPSGAAGQIVGNVSGIDHLTHEVAAYLHVEGGGWWTKPSFGMPTVPINPDGSFSVDTGTGGLDELASIYTVSVVPAGTTPPQMDSANTLDLGASSIASTYEQRYGTNLAFSGRNWGVKQSPSPAGPGGNLFSADSDDVWVDQDGLHLTIQNHGGQWYSTEVVLTENLGYGTYVFQTDSRQDILFWMPTPPLAHSRGTLSATTSESHRGPIAKSTLKIRVGEIPSLRRTPRRWFNPILCLVH
jgi:hypothetical protein